jgi:hypothetical protein
MLPKPGKKPVGRPKMLELMVKLSADVVLMRGEPVGVYWATRIPAGSQWAIVS